MIQLAVKNHNSSSERRQVQIVSVSEEEAGQRLDNFLLRQLNGVPKTRLYRAIRRGEVRVNKGRVRPDTRLEAGDAVRIPPVHETTTGPGAVGGDRWAQRIRHAIVLELPDLLVLNKPPGLAVHGGSGVKVGLIETLRAMYPEQRYLELVHRLDRDTSGLIMVARRASVLRELHAQLRGDRINKVYKALVWGRWPSHLKQVEAPLEKTSLASGERMVRVSAAGKPSLTRFRVLKRWKSATLIEAKPVTGRTHQIRVHAAHAGFPILGDDKYQTPQAQALAATLNLNRLYLHAAGLQFSLGEERYQLEAPDTDEMQATMAALDNLAD